MSRSLRLGIFIVFGLLAASVVVFLIGDKSLFMTRTYVLYAAFPSVAGLQGGAAVEVAGLREGTVKTIYLPRAPGQPVRVEMKLRDATRGVVKLDSVAIVQTQGLIGDQYVQVSIGSAHSRPVRNGDTIQGSAPLQISDLIDKANVILNNANTTLGSMNGAMGPITSAAGNLDSITGKINSGQGSLGALLNDPSAYRNFNQAAGNLASVTGKINSGQGSLGALINDPSAYRSFNQSAGNLASITGKINSGQGFIGALINDPSAYQNFNQTAGNLAFITGALRSGQGSLGALLNDPSAYRNFNQATGNLASITGKINSGQGSLGQLVNNPSMYQHLDGAAENMQEDTEALKHNFLLRGFFRKHGYQSQSDLARCAVPQLPPGAPAQRFDLPAARLFKPNQAQLKPTKEMDQAGAYLRSHPFSVVVISAGAGDSDAQRKLAASRAYAARQYLVNHFRIDAARAKITGVGKTPDVAPAGELSILVFPESGANPQAPAAVSGSADRAPAADPHPGPH